MVAELLRARGFDALTTRDAGRLGQTDADQLAFAVREERTFLTHNRVDFERFAQEYFETKREHHGMILAVRRSPHEIVRRLLIILNQVTADEMKNQIRYI